MANPPLIKLENISKIYQTSDTEPYKALSDINLTVQNGDFIAIVGPSGSGKSTLMNILGLLDHPTSGTYELDGHNISQLKETTLAKLRNSKIGFVFQSFNLLNRTSALQNVALPLIYSRIPAKERTQRAKSSLETVGLGDKLNNRPNQLSGGQQQRVAIARSLVTNPSLILADEPTGNLDTKTGDEILKLLQSLHKQGRTIIMITHSNEIARTANRQIYIQDGRIVKK